MAEVLTIVYGGINGKYMVFAAPDNTRMVFADGGLNDNGEGTVMIAPPNLLPDFSTIPMGSQAEIDFYNNYAMTQLGLI